MIWSLSSLCCQYHRLVAAHHLYSKMLSANKRKKYLFRIQLINKNRITFIRGVFVEDG